MRLPFTRTVTAGLYVLGGLAGALLYPQFTVMGQIMLDAKAKSKGELPFEEWPVIAPAKLGERLDPTAYYKRFGMRPHLVSQASNQGAKDLLPAVSLPANALACSRFCFHRRRGLVL